MNLITRNCINTAIVLHDSENQIYDYQQFCYLIDQWKDFFVNTYQVRPGQTIVLDFQPATWYYALVFASAELGLTIITDWPQVDNEEDLSNSRLQLFGLIDYVVTDNQQEYSQIRNRTFAKNTIDSNSVKDYVVNSFDYKFTIHNSYPLVAGSSGGTTGDPKKILWNHKKIYKLSQRSGQLAYVKNNSFLHTTAFNIISATIYTLPAFITARDHFFYTPNTNLVDIVIQNQINMLPLFGTQQLLEFLENTPKLNHHCDIITLFQIPVEATSLTQQKFINSVQSFYGDTTNGTGVFIKKITGLEENYQPNNLGPLRDNFYQVDIKNNLLYIQSLELDQDWATNDDQFEKTGDNYVFLGRSSKFLINNVQVDLNYLEKTVNQLFGLNGATIVVDGDYQKIYLAIWKDYPDAEIALNKHLTESGIEISYTLRNESYQRFFSGRKIDISRIRQHCRVKLKEL